MKKAMACLGLAALALTARAETILVTGNNAGGEIRLTNEQSNCQPGKKLVYLTNPQTSRILAGCWTLRDGDVLVLWSDGDFRLYQLAHFVQPAKKGGVL